MNPNGKMPHDGTDDVLDLRLEHMRQETLHLKARAGLFNMATLALFAWTVGGIVALFVR